MKPVKPEAQERINALCEMVRSGIDAIHCHHRSAVLKANEVGEAITELRTLKRVRRGKSAWFYKWVREEFAIPTSTAQLYERIHKHWDKVEKALEDNPSLTIAQCRKLFPKERAKGGGRKGKKNEQQGNTKGETALPPTIAPPSLPMPILTQGNGIAEDFPEEEDGDDTDFPALMAKVEALFLRRNLSLSVVRLKPGDTLQVEKGKCVLVLPVEDAVITEGD